MTSLTQLWRKFLAPFETMRHVHYEAPWTVSARSIRRRSAPSR